MPSHTAEVPHRNPNSSRAAWLNTSLTFDLFVKQSKWTVSMLCHIPSHHLCTHNSGAFISTLKKPSAGYKRSPDTCIYTSYDTDVSIQLMTVGCGLLLSGLCSLLSWSCGQVFGFDLELIALIRDTCLGINASEVTLALVLATCESKQAGLVIWKGTFSSNT